MKVLVVHNAYQLAGGEDTVVRNEVALMRECGDSVEMYLVSNDSVKGLIGKLTAALGVVFSLKAYRNMRRMLHFSRPDIVHVHNFFPLLSPAVFYACKAEGVPVVMTLHNFRLICPTALLMHNGKITERSLMEGPWWAVGARVYKNSLMGSLMLAFMIAFHRRVGTWRTQVDRFIVLSDFALQKFTQAGLPSSKLLIKPNFVDVGFSLVADRSGLLFVGRLSPEKGLDVLLAAANLIAGQGVSICVVGEGPLKNAVLDAYPVVESLGSLPGSEVQVRMANSMALVVPSVWYEGFPMVLVEAYACGLPVIASRIGALAELVEDGVTGLLFKPGDATDLADKMRWAIEHPQEMAVMGLAARARYEARYTPQRNYQQLMAVYRAAIGIAEQATFKTGQIQ